ncbi:MAG TPA: ABC transporter substrate-binding protein [Thermoanaerobaculia bacterium]|nr:ABC transporter substrate-binding protein [Thermoanaerobaculia bacterium]
MILSRQSLGALAVAALAALAMPGGARAAGPERTLQSHLDSEPVTLDPLLTTDVSGLVVQDLLFTPLVALDQTLSLAPGLARSWRVTADGRSFVFDLDPTATFDDGRSVTAADVRFTIERIRDPKVAALARKADFEDLEAVEVLSPSAVRVRFSRPYSERLLAFNLPILPAHVFSRGAAAAAAYGRNPVGNGPFRFVRWDPARAIVLERRAGTAGRAAGVERVIFRVLPDPATRLNAGIRGELDEFRVSPQVLDRFRGDRRLTSRFRLVPVPRLAQTSIVWNCRNPFLSDRRTRRALGLAIPRRRILSALFGGRGREVSGPYPAGVPENAPDVPPPPHAPGEAARLLSQAGYRREGTGGLAKEGRPLAFGLSVPGGNPVSRQIAEVLRQEYARLGVEMEILVLDWPALAARLDAGDFDAVLSETSFLPPNLDPYVAFHSSQVPPNGQNVGFYSDRNADRLLEAARAETDPARRLRAYREIHRRLAEDQPAAFLFTLDSLWAIHRDLEGVEISPLGLSHFLPGRRAWRWGQS